MTGEANVAPREHRRSRNHEPPSVDGRDADPRQIDDVVATADSRRAPSPCFTGAAGTAPSDRQHVREERRALPPLSAFKGEPISRIRIVASDEQDPRMHVLMALAAQEQAVAGSPSAATAAQLQMMDLRSPPAATGATPPRVTPPHRGPHGAGTFVTRRLSFPPHHDVRFRFRQRRHYRGTFVAAMVRSTHTRTPGITIVPLSARTTAPSLR